jgi:hypothetical protein
MRRSAGIAAAALAVAACGASARERARREAEGFSCRDRSASYVATHHMGGAELGIKLDCAEAGPRIVRWKTNPGGARIDDARSMTPGEFDALWNQIDGVGWQYLKDCAPGGDHEPVYQFAIQDDLAEASFRCQAQTMPYPYSSIVDPLELAANQGRKQLGDDEPADLKALDDEPRAQ